jgi:hypothetical protein
MEWMRMDDDYEILINFNELKSYQAKWANNS